MRHFIDINQLDKDELLTFLATAQGFLNDNLTTVTTPLAGKVIATLFFEPSTRTRCSFEIAAVKLGAHVLNLDAGTSSLMKGETELDTVLNLEAMGVDGFIIRHKQNGLVEQIAKHVNPSTVIINAGCGTLQHPSQAILDMLTIQQTFPHWNEITVAIIGDLAHSRVAHSDIAALLTLGVKKISLIAPPELMPTITLPPSIRLTDSIEDGLTGADVVMTLRVQHERMTQNNINVSVFQKQYQLTESLLNIAAPNAIVMHPGPVNRGVEISDEVLTGQQSVILNQVRNGVAARMAILIHVFQQ